MNRTELQTLANERLLDADALIREKRWAFAYYTAGYAVECALKSCLLAQMIHTGWVFQEKAKIDDCRTHDFRKLIQLAGLTGTLNLKLDENDAFLGNWGTVLEWKSTDRYEPKSEQEAISLRDAIADQPDGVLLWIMNYW